jgi:predicted chitinase
MKKIVLTPEQKRNHALVIGELNAIGLTNKYLQAGIVAVIYKESGLKPIVESGYQSTPASRIRQIFGGWFQYINDASIDRLKLDDRMFFNHVYSHNKSLGNQGGNDGYLYRGRGFNQLTGRWNFQDMTNKLKVDLINNPDLLATPEIAAKASARFFYDGIVNCQKTGKFLMRHKIITTSQIISVEQGALIAHDCNGGWGIHPYKDPTGGWLVTKEAAEYFYNNPV